MLKGFEEQTEPLNEYEEGILLPVILIGLTNKIGKRNAVTNSHICRKLKGSGYQISEPRLRKIINHIRIRGLVVGLVATSDGYYIAENREQMNNYLESLRGRENAIKAVRIAIEKQMEAMY